MKKAWRKLGQLYCPPSGGLHPKLVSHAANPLPIQIEGDIYRIFFSGRDRNKRSSVGAVDIDIVQRKVVREHQRPFFEHGPAGSFYADGISIGNCYFADGVRYMPFMAWQAPQDGHWRGDIGRLIVRPDLSLMLDSEKPFMTLDAVDPISLSYPWVQPLEDGTYRMWYSSVDTWAAGNGEMLAPIKWAASVDGHNWIRHGIAVPAPVGVAQAFSKPTVALNPQGGYEMWFSYRGAPGVAYRIGYARSADGIDWELDLENAGIAVSAHGWDSEMIEYPFVFDHAGRRYMLYNGNGYGCTGFGLAVLDND